MKKTAVVFLSFCLLGCRPPDAPKELDELCGYLFAHFNDSRPAAMEAGLANLDVWLESNLEETLEGYTVSNLSQTSLDALGERAREAEEMVGAAAGYESPYSVYALDWALIMSDQDDVFPGRHKTYEREWIGDEECFAEQECDYLQAENYMEDDFPLGIEAVFWNYGEYRWFEMEEGLAMVQRTWLTEPGDLSVDWLTITDQYYLNILMPQGEGTLTLQSMWIDASLGDSNVPEATALNLLISQMQGVYADVDTHLEETDQTGLEATGCSSSGRSTGALGAIFLAGLLMFRRRKL